jgi:hypothetical protein
MEKNLKDYYYYGNHDFVNDNEKEVDKVLLKDQITVKETHY